MAIRLKASIPVSAAVLTATLGLAPLAAHASPITYVLLKVTLPSGATATGTITTDGATGTLVASDITGIDIAVSGFGSSDTLKSLSDVILVGSELSATSKSLSFDFNGSGGKFGAQSKSSPTSYSGLCFADSLQICHGSFVAPSSGYEEINLPTGVSETEDFSAVSGNSIIATAVPEPLTLSLFAAGLAGAVAMHRRKKAA